MDIFVLCVLIFQISCFNAQQSRHIGDAFEVNNINIRLLRNSTLEITWNVYFDGKLINRWPYISEPFHIGQNVIITAINDFEWDKRMIRLNENICYIDFKRPLDEMTTEKYTFEIQNTFNISRSGSRNEIVRKQHRITHNHRISTSTVTVRIWTSNNETRTLTPNLTSSSLSRVTSIPATASTQSIVTSTVHINHTVATSSFRQKSKTTTHTGSQTGSQTGKLTNWLTYAIIGIGSGVTLCLIIVFVFVKIKARNKARIENELFINEDRASCNYMRLSDFYSEPATIRFESLKTVWLEKHAKNDRVFIEEYNNLPDYCQNNTFHSADFHANKNRYANVKPFDETRVQLEGNVWQTGRNCDYINASFVQGYSHKRKFIATQAPLPNTTGDFWHMVWQYNVKAIVMLVNLLENNVERCTQYWPERPDITCLYGDVQVRLVSSKVMNDDFTQRDFEIAHSNDLFNRHHVSQYFYSKWPDRGVPTVPSISLLKLILTVNENHVAKQYPIVVHCSAGVGRTGTYITLDAMHEQLVNERKFNVFSFIKEIRKQRMSLVQTAKQYIFIHQVLYENFSLPHQSIE